MESPSVKSEVPRQGLMAAVHALTCAGLVALGGTVAFAGQGWNPGKQFKDAAGRAANSAKKAGGNASDNYKRAAGTTYRFTLLNHTRQARGYTLHTYQPLKDDQPGIPLRPNYRRQIQVGSTTRPVISYNNGHGQTVRLTMYSGRAYKFISVNGVVKLVEAS